MPGLSPKNIEVGAPLKPLLLEWVFSPGSRNQNVPQPGYNLSMPLFLDDTLSLLARTPITLNTLLRDQPEIWTHRNEGEHTWSPYEVMGHLIHGEHADWIPRAKIILEYGEGKAFDPFDREAFKYESKDKPLPALLDEFARLRSENLDELRKGRPIKFGGDAVRLDDDIEFLIFAGENERTMQREFEDLIGPETEVFIDPSLR